MVDDASWVMGFLDIIDPALDRIKRLFNLEQDLFKKQDSVENAEETKDVEKFPEDDQRESGFDLDAFIKEKLSLDPSKIDDKMEASLLSIANSKDMRKSSRSRQRFR